MRTSATATPLQHYSIAPSSDKYYKPLAHVRYSYMNTTHCYPLVLASMLFAATRCYSLLFAANRCCSLQLPVTPCHSPPLVSKSDPTSGPRDTSQRSLFSLISSLLLSSTYLEPINSSQRSFFSLISSPLLENLPI